jgi:hypothetical protein
MIRRAIPDDVPEIRLLMESVPGFWQSHWSNSTVGVAIAGFRDPRFCVCARALVQRVEQELSERGQAILIADVWRDATPFYGALGWEAPEAVLLRKKLKSQNPDRS